MNTAEALILIFGIVLLGLMITSVVLTNTKAKGDHDSKEYKQAKKKQDIGWTITYITFVVGLVYFFMGDLYSRTKREAMAG